MITIATQGTILGSIWSEPVRIDSAVNVTLVGCVVQDVDGVGIEIVGSHNVRLIGCRVLRCGGAGARLPAILIRAGGSRPRSVPNDIVLSGCQVEANYGVALRADDVCNLTLCGGTKLHGRYDQARTPEDQDQRDDQPLLVVQRGLRICVDETCLLTGGPAIHQRQLIHLPLADVAESHAAVRPRWGDRTSGVRRSVLWS